MRLGRTRRVCGVALVVAGVGLASASAWSWGRYSTVGAEGHGCVWSLSLTSGVVQWSLQRGAIDSYYPGGGWAIGTPPRDNPWLWQASSTAVQPQWRAWGWVWTLVSQPSGWHRFAAAPVWPFAAAALCGGALLVRAGRRAGGAAGRCTKCGYDLRGLAAGAVCPECGAIEARARA